MGITQVDDIPSDVADGDYGIGDALGSEAALLYVAALLAIAGGALFFLPGTQGSYIRAGIAGAGIVVHPGISVSDAPIARVGDGGRYRRARGRGHRGGTGNSASGCLFLAFIAAIAVAVRSSTGRGAFGRWLKRLPERIRPPSLRALCVKGPLVCTQTRTMSMQRHGAISRGLKAPRSVSALPLESIREMRLATLPELCRTMNRAESEECIDDCLQYDIHHT